MLPHGLESAVVRILEGPEEEWEGAVAELCRAHPDHADAIRARVSEGRPPKAEDSATASVPAASTTEPMPMHIGPYRILDVLGEGGMGIVYLAQQDAPMRRRVALKLIKLGMDSKSVVARFEQERQALALMQHDGIARVLDCGTSDRGQPYFVMEYVKGIPLTDYCERYRTPLPGRIELMQQVCAAVTHAHQKGVLHRDLKPSNVLVTEDQGKIQIKIIDFGLAKAMGQKLVEASLFTELGQIVGTPEYMAPEQADPTNADIDTRADVYSLGVMLYELLVSALPFPREELRRAGMLEVQRILREVEPPRPSVRLHSIGEASTAVAQARGVSLNALQNTLRTDLDWLVMKALEKDRARRYETANALAADLQRYLDHEPLEAGPPSATYRLKKLLRRHRGQVFAAGAVLATALVGASVSVDYAVQAGELAADLTGKVREFEQLKVALRHKRAVAAEALLYPAWPTRIPAMESWREDCLGLLARRGDIEDALRTVRRRALPPTEEELRRDRESHPRLAEWEALGRRIESLRHAQRIREGTAGLVEPTVPAHERSLPVATLNQFAWIRVAPGVERLIHGEEALGLAYARLAVEGSAGHVYEWAFLDTLASALVANGQDAEARARGEEALSKTPEAYRQLILDSCDRRVREMENAGTLLAEAEAEHAALADVIATRRTYRFADDDEATAFLHETLDELMLQLAELEQNEMARVERRLGWARALRALTRDHPQAPATWADARAAIARADGVTASELYSGQSIELREEDVVGLVPLGANPAGLWEFYDLRSAWDGDADPATIAIPERRADGSFEVTDETGIVLVLLPGGTFFMGAQADDPDGPNHDPRAGQDAILHAVSLEPFFIGKYEVTQGQWARLWTWDDRLRQPSFYGPGRSEVGRRFTLSHPVEQVDWNMCSTLLFRHGFVLPTEAQWEYACRGGQPTPWWSGDDQESLAGKANVLDRSGEGQVQTMEAGVRFDDGFEAHAPVGTFTPNGYGLHDTHGNVWEWCRDESGNYGCERPGDGMRASIGSDIRVFRGGSFKHPPMYGRSSHRANYPLSTRSEFLGVRCARPLRVVQ